METVFFDIDTQTDFLTPNGKSYSGGADEILPRLRDLLALAERHRYTTISTVDIRAAGGATQVNRQDLQKVLNLRVLPEMPKLPRRVIGPAAQGGVVFEPGLHYLIETTDANPFVNPWLSYLVKRNKLNNHQAIVFGVAQDSRLKHVVSALLGAKIKTYVISDITVGDGQLENQFEEFRRNGATVLQLQELLEIFRWLGHMPLTESQQTTVGVPRPKYPGKAPRH